jgi:hypothetical protein
MMRHAFQEEKQMINGFEIHDAATAPAGSAEILNSVQKAWGFVPNLHRVRREPGGAGGLQHTLEHRRENRLYAPGTQPGLSRHYLRE